ncbi:MAG: hypothetical protein NTU91_10125 [Chloroflexi bacterium]|nr:hypothetical protein [Chloroflexota bacterium]
MRVLLAVTLLFGALTPVVWADGCNRLSLDVQPVHSIISSNDPGELRISLVNNSQRPVWVDRRLVLGYHIYIFVVDRNGHPIRLGYPSFTLVLPKKGDFKRVQPGERIEKSLKVTMDMLPGFAQKSGVWTFAVKVIIFDTGSQFGIQGWTGTLKSYVKLTAHGVG